MVGWCMGRRVVVVLVVSMVGWMMELGVCRLDRACAQQRPCTTLHKRRI